jgi:hypothetical protein
VPPGSLSCHQLSRVCLGFVSGLFSVYLGFHLGFLVFFFPYGFNKILLSRLIYFGFYIRFRF